MANNKKDPVLVVLQLSGGNDYHNSVVPYANPLYWDYRPSVRVPEDEVLHLDDKIGFHPNMGPLRDMYNEGNMAIIHGVGYANSIRSHFRSMDIWHTCEPDKIGTEGWLGRALRDIDPNKENVVTGVSFGTSMFRAMSVPGVPVASIADLDNYGLLTGMSGEEQRARALETFTRAYSPAIGTGPIMEYLGQTGLDAMKGADILKVAPEMYSSTVEYSNSQIAKSLKGIAQIHLANLGTRVLYCDHGSFDTHSNENPVHAKLWKEVSEAVRDFFDDLREHDAADNVTMLLFSEFGRRSRDNGSGSDHGAGGVAFMIGDKVKGGQYGEYPSMAPEDLEQGDVVYNHDFRGLYTAILEDWMGLDAVPIVGGTYEKFSFIGK